MLTLPYFANKLMILTIFKNLEKTLETAFVCICDKTESESNFLMFYTVFRLFHHAKLTCSEMALKVLVTFGKNFVILAFLTKIIMFILTKLRCEKNMLLNK